MQMQKIDIAAIGRRAADGRAFRSVRLVLLIWYLEYASRPPVRRD